MLINAYRIINVRRRGRSQIITKHWDKPRSSSSNCERRNAQAGDDLLGE